jgi:vancomycin aglycone glucosyltransferase
MRVSLSTYESRGDVEPMVGIAVRLRALGAEVRVCAPPDKDFAELLPRSAAESVAAVAEGSDALAAGGMMPAGVWR